MNSMPTTGVCYCRSWFEPPATYRYAVVSISDAATLKAFAGLGANGSGCFDPLLLSIVGCHDAET
jgi:hypothetical protein